MGNGSFVSGSKILGTGLIAPEPMTSPGRLLFRFLNFTKWYRRLRLERGSVIVRCRIAGRYSMRIFRSGQRIGHHRRNSQY
ncbi:hypothetical protein B0T26DRAFT_725261 [Lasiosphaeria miniovina]|uniref:Uncharacterized protein n=1 Tax=Lasiosphaeria miniovina TaxID=1954250 RepID=A0AA40DJM1_9PEZI|nr:uncharacterized protein B0T26DRAFT_725261 [Lasiosphaeria miniovina]KAK0706039.1 hypothetical protein B0T26DRAFT_725261 [Lasiosphaeria miniovina]